VIPRKLKIILPPKRNTSETASAVNVASVINFFFSGGFISLVSERKIGTSPSTSIATKIGINESTNILIS
jgi:hypothetical protein